MLQIIIHDDPDNLTQFTETISSLLYSVSIANQWNRYHSVLDMTSQTSAKRHLLDENRQPH